MNLEELKDSYRVIIIGAGPAGLSCALRLLENGVSDVLVAERFRFPRDKCCAGYITNKTKKEYESFGLDFASCHYSLIEDFNIFYRLKPKQRINNKFLYTNRQINRVELDDAFFRLAVAKGVSVCEQARVTAHDAARHSVTVNGERTLRYEQLVFADGTLGFGSRYQRTDKRNIAMQLLIHTGRPDSIDLHFGVSPRGYGWVSSCGGVTNIGLTDVYDSETDYRELFRGYMRSCGIESELSGLYAAFTPIGVRKPILNGDVYFIGDALGACDPLTLSGLRYGLKSGERAALAIGRNDRRLFTRYAAELRFKFALMALMQKLFYLKVVSFGVFNIGCRFCGRFIAFAFNNFFVNKK